MIRIHISIHASAKEATKVRAILGLDKIFQSTPPRRRRPRKRPTARKKPRNFNPRLREGGDDTVCCTVETPTDFNPRLREGGD